MQHIYMGFNDVTFDKLFMFSIYYKCKAVYAMMS